MTFCRGHASLKSLINKTTNIRIDAFSESRVDDQVEKFTAITDITEDGYGHVTGITTKKLTVVDTHNDVNGVETLVRGSNNVVTTDISVSTKDGTTETGSFSIGAAADSIIKVTGSGSATTLALEWGSF